MCTDHDILAVDTVNVKHYLSSPSLALPRSKVAPVPLPRRKSLAAHERLGKCANINSQQQSRVRSSCAVVSDVLGSAESVKANSCEDICTAADCCVHRGSSRQASDLVANGELCVFSIEDGTSASDVAISVNGIDVRDPVCDSKLSNVLPLRHQQLSPKEFAVKEDTHVRSLDIDNKISGRSTEVELCVDHEISTNKQKLFPQPKPRLSLMSTGEDTSLPELAPGQLSDNTSYDGLAVTDDSVVIQMDSTRPDAHSTKTMQPVNTGGTGIVRDRVSEKDCQPSELHKHDSSLVEWCKQRASEVQNNVDSKPIASEVFVPSRAAPPPPLPKPKVVLHHSGSSEVMQRPCGDCSGLENVGQMFGNTDTCSVIKRIKAVETSRKDRGQIRELVGNIEVSSMSAKIRPASSDSDVFYHSDASSATPTIVLSTSKLISVSFCGYA